METLCGVCDTALQPGSSAIIGGCSHTYCPPCLLLWDESEPGFSARLLTTRKERGRWRGADRFRWFDWCAVGMERGMVRRHR